LNSDGDQEKIKEIFLSEGDGDGINLADSLIELMDWDQEARDHRLHIAT
jgi:hypothetical protein